VRRWVIVSGAVAVIVAAALILVYSFTAPFIEVHDVEIRLGVGSAALFLTIHNHGLLGDCLTNVKVLSPEGVIAELHRSVMDEKGVMRMEKVDSICVGGLGEVRLGGIEAGGYHIMILGETDHMDRLKIELLFQSGRIIPVEIMPTASQEHTEDHTH